MATLVETTVDTGGTGDYSSLNAAEAANFGASGADITAAGTDEYVICGCKCTNEVADTTAVTINGMTTDSSHYIFIASALGYRHTGIMPTSGTAYRLDVSGSALGNYTSHVYIMDLAVRMTSTANSQRVIAWQGAVDGCYIMYNVVVAIPGAYTNAEGISTYNATGGGETNRIGSNIVYGCSGTTARSFKLSSDTSTIYLYNNTATGGDTNYLQADGTVVAKNNIAFNGTTDWAGTYDAASTHNGYTNGQSGPSGGSNAVDLGSSAAALFLDPTNDNYHLKAVDGVTANDSPAYRAGTNLHGDANFPITKDIDRNNRSASITFDLGADQLTTQTRSVTVDTGGSQDWSSLNAAEAANFGAGGADYTAEDELVECDLICTDGQADTTNVTISGQTTSATNDLTISTNTAYAHRGVFPTSGNRYRLDTTSNSIWANVSFITLRGLAVRISLDNNTRRAINYEGGVGCVLNVSHCVVTTGTVEEYIGAIGIGWYTNSVAFTANCWNNIVYGFANTSDTGILANGTTHTSFIHSNTVVNCKTGIKSSSGTVTVKNNLAFNNTADYSGTFDAASTNNGYTSGQSGPTGGSNAIDLGSAETVVFNAPGSDIYHLVEDSPARGVGTDLSSDANLAITDDILGGPRPTTPSIGAHEYQVLIPTTAREPLSKSISKWSLDAVRNQPTYHP